MAKKNPISAVAKRFGITAREARDIATAVSNAAKVTTRNVTSGASVPYKRLGKDIVKQTKETGRAATTGKSGTRPLKVVPDYMKTKTKTGTTPSGRKGTYVVRPVKVVKSSKKVRKPQER